MSLQHIFVNPDTEEAIRLVYVTSTGHLVGVHYNGWISEWGGERWIRAENPIVSPSVYKFPSPAATSADVPGALPAETKDEAEIVDERLQ